MLTDLPWIFFNSVNDYHSLSTVSLSDYSRAMAFYFPHDVNENLLSIVNKYIRSMPAKDVQNYLALALAEKDTDGIGRFMRENPFLVYSVCAVLILLIILVATLLINSRKNAVRSQELRRASDAKSEFLSRMSHDMRTPLNAVLGFAHLAEEEDDVPPQVKDYLSKINSSGQYLLGLINDVLDMSKIESGKVTLNEQPVDGPRFLSAIEDDFRRQAEEKGIRLVTDFSKSQTPWVIMDSLRSRQIYSNLLSNAVKYSDPGTEIYWGITDTPLDDHTMHMVSVIRDQGHGMTPEFMEHMFDAFEQENAPTTGSGVGLGLSIVKALVALMGGTIRAESEPGKGSTFTIEMNRKLGGAAPQAALSAVGHVENLKGKRVLLTEDHPLNTQIAVKLLEKQEMLVDTAENGRISLEKFSASAPGYYDAILMDIRMPVMDGLAAAKAIRALDRADAKSIPIIAMTANAFEEDEEKSKAAGMNAHLAKPIDPEKLYETLARLTEHVIA